ncbi:MAG: histidine kinase [Pseudomonadota bacterium]
MTASPPGKYDLRQILRHALQVLVFNSLLWALQMLGGSDRWGTWDVAMVYNQAIGLSIWAFVEVGRVPLLRGGEGWPGWPRSVVLVVGSVVAGWLVGTTLGDWYCGCKALSLFSDSPNRMRSAITITLAASAVCIYYFYSRGKAMAQSEHIARAERDATLARLALLQSQLEPHMLFNTLANLRVLIALDPPRAQAMLDRLIAFLRATLTASRTQAHSLADEFARLDDYLQLMAMRMGPRLQARFDLPDALRGLQVPPLLLQPLVENSIQHGLEPQVEGGRIEVSARREGEHLVLAVRDTGVGLEGAPASNGTQFGLKQVRERLHTLYGPDAAFSLGPAPDAEGGTLAVLRLPVNLHATPASP